MESSLEVPAASVTYCLSYFKTIDALMNFKEIYKDSIMLVSPEIAWIYSESHFLPFLSIV